MINSIEIKKVLNGFIITKFWINENELNYLKSVFELESEMIAYLATEFDMDKEQIVSDLTDMWKKVEY